MANLAAKTIAAEAEAPVSNEVILLYQIDVTHLPPPPPFFL